AGRGGGGGAGAGAGSGAGAGTSGASGSAAAGAGGANGTAGEGGAGRGAAGAAGEAGGGSEAGAGGEGGGSGSRLYCPYDWMRVQTLGRSTDGSIDFELQRCMATVCGGGCQVYSVYFRITHDGRTDEAVDEQIEYTQTHHNWSDSLTATLPDRTLRWRVGITEPFGMEDTVAIDALDGSPILEDVVVPSETEGFFDWM
ncbi:MAG TPA: hypothetical protein VGK73_23210, partial [Polyangiaceae bacterium]